MTATRLGKGFSKPYLPKGGPNEPKPVPAPPRPAVAADARDPIRRRGGHKTLRPVRPNAGIAATYLKRLNALIDEMGRSVEHWLTASYRRNEDAITSLAEDEFHIMVWNNDNVLVRADSETDLSDGFYISGPCTPGPCSLDRAVLYASISTVEGNNGGTALDAALAFDAASPVNALAREVRELRKRWQGRFDRASQELAEYFARSVANRNDAELKKILKRAGIAISFKTTPEMREALKAIVAENVALIKSIPQQYLAQVEGLTMRSVLAGGDAKVLYDGLRHQLGVTKRRAKFITSDQNSKATAHVQRLRYIEADIERGIWHHSAAGKTWRPTHVANDGKEFDVRKGWYDPAVGKYIWPGTEPNCKCFFTPILD